MGDPQHAYPVIHITGTNGKGSTAQMITRLLMAQGLQRRHVHQPAPRADQRAHRPQRRADRRRGRSPSRSPPSPTSRCLTGVRPTYFEACTAAAFRWFADVAVDVGRDRGRRCSGGGTPPTSSTRQVAVITNIGMDHNEFAGPTHGRHRPREGGHHQARHRGRDRRDRPRARRRCFSAPPAATSAAARRRLRRARATSWRSAAGCVDIRTPTTIYPDVFVPLHGAPPGRQRRRRADRGRGVLRRAARRGRRRARASPPS